ncbi:MAG TPA: bifunctional lysylphosphatidylglycerol flippase/synthetase MprF [Longimicrobiales bacterium]|nr:bifunctional lysylphosphatidylglycerol flippase/synthetase MprF [Longimicrobiales bacterium]
MTSEGQEGLLRAFWGRVRAFIPVALFLGALWAIHHELAEFRVQDVLAAAGALPWRALLSAIGFTALSFVVLTGYDTLGLRYIGRPLPYRQSAFASFIGYSFSQALGFPLLTGAPLRYRLYSGWGLGFGEVRDLVTFYSATFWLGFATLAGAVFLIAPMEMPDHLRLPLMAFRPLGALMLLVSVAYLTWCARRRPAMRIRAWVLEPPSLKIAVPQVVISVLDWAVAGAVMYVLLPPGSQISYFAFLGLFLLAQIVGLLSNVPGGLGVFEAIIIVSLPAAIPESQVLGSLLVYRAIYYLLPLLVGSVALGGYEVRQRRTRMARAAAHFARGVSLVVPQALAMTVFVAGAVLLFSGALPAEPARLRELVRFVPLPLIELSHFLGSVVGGLLLVLAWGLQRRVNAAYLFTLVMLVAGIAFSMLKGLDYEEALVLTVVLAAVWASRDEFYRPASLLTEPFTFQWSLAVAGALLAAGGLGLIAFRRVDYGSDLWWQFALTADAPRSLRATVGALVVVLGFSALRLLRPAGREVWGGPPDLARVEALVARSPWTYAWLALLGDKELIVHDDGFVMYAVEGRSWVTMGDPVGPENVRADLAWTFRELVDRHDGWPVFYQARPDNLPLYIDLGLTLTKLGEEARVPLDAFSLEGGRHSGHRKTLRRVEREGGQFEILEPPAVPAALPRLRAISEEWLSARSTREKGFSLGVFRDDYLRRTPIAVVRVGGRIAAFANVLAGADREELTIDLMRYGQEAPANVMEYLFLRLMLWGREHGYHWFNLGMAPLSGMEWRPMAPLWNRVSATVFRFGEHFYNFQGLREYKEKFDPVWEPRYLASPGGFAFPRILTNVATLISGGVRGVFMK